MNKIATWIPASMLLVAGLTCGTQAATIDQVEVRQRWPWSHLVDIDYVLSCGPTEKMDVTVTAYDGSRTLTLPGASLSGDLYSVSNGTRRIVWDPMATSYTNLGALTSFRVGLAITNVPVYMIVDLTKTAGEAGHLEYIYPGDARLETTGRFTNVWFGVTNDPVYATSKLVLRRLPAGTFNMGSGGLATTLTTDFYVGVFEVTQRQWELIKGNKPSYFTNSIWYASRPAERLDTSAIRGAGVDWPSSGHTVATNSFLGLLRAKTGLDDFDMPTEAQWEYACRAGTTTVFNDGDTSANVSGANADTNVWLNALGRYIRNGGYNGANPPDQNCGPTNGTATVGSYQPNNWGLHDTLGNVDEKCLDYYAALGGGADPVGGISGNRVWRGGNYSTYSYGQAAALCTTTTRTSAPEWSQRQVGIRIVRNLP